MDLSNLLATTNLDLGEESESEKDEIDSTLDPLLYDLTKEMGSNDKENELMDEGEAVYKQEDMQTEMKLKTGLKRKHVSSDTPTPRSDTSMIIVTN
jgi:hypothetical protein